MNKCIVLLLTFISFQSIAQQKNAEDTSASKLVLNGIYSGKNIYVQNPLHDDVKMVYCTDSVIVNGRHCLINLNQSAFEIKLDSIIKIQGTAINIFIYHKNTCMPKVLQPMSFPPSRCDVEFTSFTIDSTGNVHFTTINGKSGNRPDFIIEQRRGKVWRPVLYIPQKWNTYNTYDTSIILTTGNNMFNLRETYDKSLAIGLTCITVTSPIPAIICKIDSARTQILFSDSAYYQIETATSKKLLNGYTKTIDISFLQKGEYIVYYENEKMIFTIPERSKLKK